MLNLIGSNSRDLASSSNVLSLEVCLARVIVIGAGPMGLAAYQSLKDGHEVDLLEASCEPGSWSDERLIDDSCDYLTELNPALKSDDVIEVRVARLQHMQPLSEVGFAAKIPTAQTPIGGLQIADTCFYYPEDCGIAESVRLGRHMARAIAL
jgi:protoporphyrinogen oxidase